LAATDSGTKIIGLTASQPQQLFGFFKKDLYDLEDLVYLDHFQICQLDNGCYKNLPFAICTLPVEKHL
jgi:hypothetical protein